MRYLDQSTRDENEEARRQGIPVSRIAELRHMEVSELCVLMGWPQWRELPTDNMVSQPADYLWSLDRLDGVL